MTIFLISTKFPQLPYHLVFDEVTKEVGSNEGRKQPSRAIAKRKERNKIKICFDS